MYRKIKITYNKNNQSEIYRSLGLEDLNTLVEEVVNVPNTQETYDYLVNSPTILVDWEFQDNEDNSTEVDPRVELFINRFGRIIKPIEILGILKCILQTRTMHSGLRFNCRTIEDELLKPSIQDYPPLNKVDVFTLDRIEKLGSIRTEDLVDCIRLAWLKIDQGDTILDVIYKVLGIKIPSHA